MDENLRIGYGEDAHRLVEGRMLWVGGVEIAGSPVGPEAHSDGDVLIHALADALLSAWGIGDIGRLFPPGDPRFRDLSGAELLRRTLDRVRGVAGRLQVRNVAAVVTLDSPKLGEHREAMERRLTGLLAVEAGRVGISFKTSEGLAPGHIQARVTVLATGASASR